MSLVKVKQEPRVILDFSRDNISKNLVQQSLRKANVNEIVRIPESNIYKFIENYIAVGTYQIKLSFASVDSTNIRSKLKEYGGFQITIYEKSRRNNEPQLININRDRRFKTQYWLKLNLEYELRVKNLVDIIIHLKRLNNLKMFL